MIPFLDENAAREHAYSEMRSVDAVAALDTRCRLGRVQPVTTVAAGPHPANRGEPRRPEFENAVAQSPALAVDEAPPQHDGRGWTRSGHRIAAGQQPQVQIGADGLVRREAGHG